MIRLARGEIKLMPLKKKSRMGRVDMFADKVPDIISDIYFPAKVKKPFTGSMKK